MEKLTNKARYVEEGDSHKGAILGNRTENFSVMEEAMDYVEVGKDYTFGAPSGTRSINQKSRVILGKSFLHSGGVFTLHFFSLYHSVTRKSGA
ncbi:hypothetical protein TthAA22_24800 (plasmid) [Thermus thermophilus]|nr:hypothetical protein TthAA22_24800 [Thermus thermophilus]